MLILPDIPSNRMILEIVQASTVLRGDGHEACEVSQELQSSFATCLNMIPAIALKKRPSEPYWTRLLEIIQCLQ